MEPLYPLVSSLPQMGNNRTSTDFEDIENRHLRIADKDKIQKKVLQQSATRQSLRLGAYLHAKFKLTHDFQTTKIRMKNLIKYYASSSLNKYLCMNDFLWS
jgi:hypothetical protein